ncbi:MAG: hypothetical protein ACI4VD_00770, partial [Limosilactobacillus mucosae]
SYLLFAKNQGIVGSFKPHSSLGDHFLHKAGKAIADRVSALDPGRLPYCTYLINGGRFAA